MGTYQRRSREDRLQEIQLGALEVFLQKGYRNTSMEDIIHNTSLSKGGFYHYYQSKEDILIDLIRAKNFNYLRAELRVKKDATPDEVCQHLARVFAKRTGEENTQSRLVLMMAMELANDTQAFYELYYAVERESIDLIVSLIKKVNPSFDPATKKDELMLLYRINNTLHFVSNLYTQREGWDVNTQMLYELYYEMFKKLILPGGHAAQD